jgi:D-amino-acid dehydrogenase
VKVAIVGGGAVGLCAALDLRRAGAEVIVLERGVVGSGASSGNAGWITPGFSVPLAAPGTTRRALRWLLDPGGPVRIRPRLDPQFAAWCLRFWRSGTTERYRAGIGSLLGLNECTFALFDQLHESGVDFDMYTQGVVFAALTDEGLREERELMAELESLGYPWPIEELDAPALRELEPGLTADVRGGFHAPHERHVRPETLLAGLVRALRGTGAEVREHAAVDALRHSRTGWRIGVGHDEVIADRVVLAAGAWTAELARLTGSRIPLEAARGYSYTVPGASDLQHALYLVEAKVACTPFAGAARVAGMLDLAGLDETIPPRRSASLRAAVSCYLPGWTWDHAPAAWAGLRPLSPDGLPVIGEVPRREGLFVASGHGMLGITLAPATAELLTPLVLAEQSGLDRGPFAPGRFSRG